jgi:hypothetical protein
VPFYFINLWLISYRHRYCTYLYYLRCHQHIALEKKNITRWLTVVWLAVVSSADGLYTVTLWRGCHSTSASAWGPFWPPVPRPRLLPQRPTPPVGFPLRGTLRDREAGSEKRATEPSGRRSGDEIQTGDCEARPEKRAAGGSSSSERSERRQKERLITNNDGNPLVDGRWRGGRGAHADPLNS